MAEKKRNTSQSQMMEPKPGLLVKAPSGEKDQLATKAARTERKEPVKQEIRATTTKKNVKRNNSLMARIRNNRVGRFIIEAYYELRHKVTWPTFEEARNMTIMVLLISAVVAAILALADFGLLHLFLLINNGK